ATFVQKVEPPSEVVRLSIPLGWRIPYLAGACGKVFLAFTGTQERKQALAHLPRFTQRTISHPAKYEAEVEAARARGYATDDQEYMDGVRAVAAPVVGASGALLGVILVVGLCVRFNVTDMASFGDLIARKAGDLSGSMGAPAAIRE
ncbi:MAG: hypothetical protein KGJ86_18790, partial [Chloroflexota bacterium]|nr:hypothetical protein [Chloroflexota bacterium]